MTTTPQIDSISLEIQWQRLISIMDEIEISEEQDQVVYKFAKNLNGKTFPNPNNKSSGGPRPSANT